MAGRPSTYSAERGEAVERALAAGAPLSVAAASVGVSTRTLNRWLEHGLVARPPLRAVPDDGHERELPDDDEAIQKALLGSVLAAARRGDWRASVWLLERRWPERFARR
jgi:hypothetical protein